MPRLFGNLRRLLDELSRTPGFSSRSHREEAPGPRTLDRSAALHSVAGSGVTSHDLAGKPYLLWFYPKAMTPGCTAEGDALRDQFAALQARGVDILDVSFGALADNATFVRDELPVPLALRP